MFRRVVAKLPGIFSTGGEADVQKKDRGWGKARWVVSAGLVLALMTAGGLWSTFREPSAVVLKYGEFKQVLQDPTVSFQNVHVTRAEIRGEIVSSDPVSGGRGASEQRQVTALRTPRVGLETDADLQQLLD